MLRKAACGNWLTFTATLQTAHTRTVDWANPLCKTFVGIRRLSCWLMAKFRGKIPVSCDIYCTSVQLDSSTAAVVSSEDDMVPGSPEASLLEEYTAELETDSTLTTPTYYCSRSSQCQYYSYSYTRYRFVSYIYDHIQEHYRQFAIRCANIVIKHNMIACFNIALAVQFHVAL